VLLEIRHQAGETVPVNTVVAAIGDNAQGVHAPEDAARVTATPQIAAPVSATAAPTTASAVPAAWPWPLPPRSSSCSLSSRWPGWYMRVYWGAPAPQTAAPAHQPPRGRGVSTALGQGGHLV
jgi:pyruvate/2-oxoglutarate dehydrogenase complex dihydrolipoamide acyltransferase (E2) component